MKLTPIFPILIIFLSCTGQKGGEISDSPKTVIALGEPVSTLSDRIWDIYQDTKGNYWFGSNGNGLYLYDGKNLTLITTKDGLIDNTIRGIQEDRFGNILVETPKGINKYDGKSFARINPIISKDYQWRLDSNDLWFNCNGNANDVYRYDGENLYQLRLPRQDLQSAFGFNGIGLSYSPYTVFGIDKDKQGNIWFGTVIAGAFRYDGESFLWIGEKELSRLPDGREPGVRSILEDKDGNIWLSNFLNKYKINSEDPIPYKKLSALDIQNEQLDGAAYFNAGLTADNGDLWMTTYGGSVWKFDGEELLKFPIKNGETDVLLISIYQDNAGKLWLGTDNNGVYKHNGKSFEKFEPK